MAKLLSLNATVVKKSHTTRDKQTKGVNNIVIRQTQTQPNLVHVFFCGPDLCKQGKNNYLAQLQCVQPMLRGQ